MATTAQNKPGKANPVASPEVWALELKRVTRRFGTIEALSDVSLSVRRGEFFSLLGPSGCGKTTLLRLIAGLDMPDSGTLNIGGVDASAIPAHRRHVNTVFQSYALFPHLTVRDNVGFGLRMKRRPEAELKDRVGKVMKLVEITDLSERRPSELSGGQKQRVALARAVVNEPDVLLLDEPLGALDMKLRKQLQSELHQLQRRLGLTFLHVTHDQEEALAMSDRIAVMNAGRVEQVDTAEALYERPRTRFVAQFLGACNLLPGTITSLAKSEATVASGLGELRVALREQQSGLRTGKELTLAVRPEKLQLNADALHQGNVVRARIEDCIYSGAETQYRLRQRDMILNVVALNARTGHQGFKVGEDVTCTFSPEALVILED